MFKIKLNMSILVSSFILGVISPATLSASEITLSLKDQDLTISGEFAGFQQEAYVVATEAGQLYVPAEYVDCEGQDCMIIVSANTQGN